ncbi:hypothetical protein [Cryptosporangium aurantiacum]|uniref:Uncharacterized protein n=1 Tax=Cryptosporangium aurantiacum TaxID=134849 RepID=A0A1M7QTD9_9ACTN|nr:hypothetical protein [Cryptosporangium aurantiacum]SHN34994.1 hypothetical protein SAMN05443668_105333 [Cryptosporangium aurantiacum]
MRDNGLTYAAILEITAREAQYRGLEIDSSERDKVLHVTIRPGANFGPARDRTGATFWTTGTGAFLCDFDDWQWVRTDYTSADQEEALRDITEVAARYFRGDGVESVLTSRWLRRQRRILRLDIDGQTVNLQRRTGPVEATPADLTVGRLMTKDGVLFGYLALDTQQLMWRQRVSPLRVRRWSETKRRYRLDLLDDWDDGFLENDDEAELAAGRFAFKGEIYLYEEQTDDEARTALTERFAGWE